MNFSDRVYKWIGVMTVVYWSRKLRRNVSAHTIAKVSAGGIAGIFLLAAVAYVATRDVPEA